MEEDPKLLFLEKRLVVGGLALLPLALALFGFFAAKAHKIDLDRAITESLAFGIVIFGPFVYVVMRVAARVYWKVRR